MKKITHDISPEQIKQLVVAASRIEDEAACDVSLFRFVDDDEFEQVYEIDEADFVELQIVDYDDNHDYGTLDSLLSDVGVATDALEMFDGDHERGVLYGYKINVAK